MTLTHRLLSLSLALLFMPTAAARAQSPEQAPLDPEQTQKLIEQKKELTRKTFVLLDEIVAAIPSLRLPENRALVQSSAADLLWTHDEKRARVLFKEALNSLGEIINKIDNSQPRTAEWAALQQRKEILQMIARRDPQMALEALRAILQSSSSAGTKAKDSRSYQESELEQSLALQVAANDPKLALQMAKDGLAKGFSLELLNVLRRLQSTDAEAATQLAGEVIAKLRAEKSQANESSLWIAVEILQMAQPRASGAELLGQGQLPTPPTPLKLEEQDLRDLTDIIATAALASAENNRLYPGLLAPVMPLIQKWSPERAALLQQRMEEITPKLDPRGRMYLEYATLLREGTTEALLDAASTAKTPEARDLLNESAAWKAFMDGDAERARQIVNDKIQDSATRDRMTQSIEQQSLWRVVLKGKLDEARQRIARLKSKDERAMALSYLAFDAALKGEKKIAIQLLEEARTLVEMKPRNETQLTALLQIVRAYSVAEPARCFELIETLIDRANELINAAATLDGFVGSGGAFKKGELVLPPGYAAASMRYQQYGQQLAALALINFDRTKAAADRFQRKETRIIARLLIAQGVLSERFGSGVSLYEGAALVGY